MIKYIFFPAFGDHWYKLANELYKKEVAKPILWLGDDIHYFKAYGLFGKDVIRDLEHRHYPYNIKNIEYNGQHLDFFSSINYLRTKNIVLKMLDRLDLYGSFGRLDREIYFNYNVIWALKKIEKSKPDVLICTEAPHDYVKYIIYEICLFLNIPCFKFISCPLAPLLGFQNMKTNEKVNLDFIKKGKFDKILNNKFKNYINEIINKKNNSYIDDNIKAQKERNSILNRLFFFFDNSNQGVDWTTNIYSIMKDMKHNISMFLKNKYSPINPNRHGIISRLLMIKSKKRILINKINKIERVNIENLNYIYFPLHYEPERTTNPDGGFFQDQFIAISYLRKLVPDDIKIILKEHPSQINYVGKGIKGRSPLIYNLIKNLKNVEITDVNHNSVELIKNSIFVSTITGTVALEAAILSKKALTFGSTWYEGCPNIFSWYDKISYEMIVDCKIYDENKILDFLIKYKNQYSILGFQNKSQARYFNSYIDNDFKKIQYNSAYKILERFFQKNFNHIQKIH